MSRIRAVESSLSASPGPAAKAPLSPPLRRRRGAPSTVSDQGRLPSSEDGGIPSSSKTPRTSSFTSSPPEPPRAEKASSSRSSHPNRTSISPHSVRIDPVRCWLPLAHHLLPPDSAPFLEAPFCKANAPRAVQVVQRSRCSAVVEGR
jgi:hypothetical protein